MLDSMQQFMIDWLLYNHPDAKPCKKTFEESFIRENFNEFMGKYGRFDYGWCLYWNNEIDSTCVLTEKDVRKEITGYECECMSY